MKSLYCHFHARGEPYALAIEYVARIVQVDRLAPMALCPPLIAGLCVYRREAIPVVVPSLTIGFEHRTPNDAPAERVGPATVLILEGKYDSWGFLIQNEGTTISLEEATRHEPRTNDRGIEIIGSTPGIEHSHAIIEPEGTWLRFRERILAWYQTLHGEGLSRTAPRDEDAHRNSLLEDGDQA